MKNYIYKAASIFFALMTFTSCENDILTTVNPNNMTNESFWKTKDDFTKGLNAMYGTLQMPNVSGSGLHYEILRSDLGGTEAWYGNQNEFTQLKWSDGTDYVNKRWSELYAGIFRANQVIHYTESTNVLTGQEKDLILAQARFMRAYCYFWLVNGYQGVVVHDKLAMTPDEMHKPLTPKEEVLSKMIIPDFEYAAEILPKTWDDDNLGRFTWGAAKAMLGKTYLFNKELDKAHSYFKTIVDEAESTGLYRLVPNFMDNFTTDAEYNSESILEVSFSDNYKPGNGCDATDEINGSEATGIAAGFATLFSGGYNFTMPTYWCQELFVAAEEMDPANAWTSSHKRSMRTYASIVVEFADGDYYQAPLTPDTIPETGEIIDSKTNFNFGQSSKVKKWTRWDRVPNEDSNTGGRTGINYRAIRYADILLMYAETLIAQGDVESAIKYIDQVRSRAGVITLASYMADNGGKIPQLHISNFANGMTEYNYVDANAENVMTHLQMVERVLELAFEGHRWYDLVRWGIAKESFDYHLEEEKKLCGILCGAEDKSTIPSGSPKVYPLFLNERVRPDFGMPSKSYSPATHDYFPIPSCEKSSNNALK